MAKGYGSLQLKVFTSALDDHESYSFYPDPGQRFTPLQLMALASMFIENLKEQFPGNEFKLVHKGRNRYNVIPVEVHTA